MAACLLAKGAGGHIKKSQPGMFGLVYVEGKLFNLYNSLGTLSKMIMFVVYN